MKANELSLGNWTNKGVLMGITPRYGLFGFGNTSIKWHEVEPIPLTEEWYLKLGFGVTKKGNHIEWVKGEFGIVNGKLPQSHYQKFQKECKYVHQLQNLYFALTGEELTIKY